MKAIRMLVYKGSDEFVHKCLRGRSVVGEKVTKDGTIRESYIGDHPTMCSFDELELSLLPKDPP